MKKNIGILLLLIIINFLAFVTFVTIDPIYQTIQKSFKSAQDKDKKYDIKSTEYTEFSILLDNHWKLSTPLSTFEDIFYPVRKWDSNIIDSFIGNTRNQNKIDQLVSVRNIEKATKVRSKRAYFWAKRRNFKDENYNRDFKKKLNQWQGNLLTLIDNKIALSNSIYNTIPNVTAICLSLVAILYFVFKLSFLSSALIGGVMISTLIIASHQFFVTSLIPFHWMLLLGLLWFTPVYRANSNMNKQLIYLKALSIPLLIGMTTPIGAFGGSIVMIAMLYLPKLKSIIMKICCVHPFGLAILMNYRSNISKTHLIGLLVIIGSMMTLLRLVNFEILFTSPIIYYGEVGIITTAILLLTINGIIISEESTEDPSLKPMAFIGLLIGIIIHFMSQQFFPNLSVWIFSFFWHPIIMWFSIMLIAARNQELS